MRVRHTTSVAMETNDDPERMFLACKTFFDHHLAARTLALRRENDALREELQCVRAREFHTTFVEYGARRLGEVKMAVERLYSQGGRDALQASATRHGISVAFVDGSVRVPWDSVVGRFVHSADAAICIMTGQRLVMGGTFMLGQNCGSLGGTLRSRISRRSYRRRSRCRWEI